MKFYFQRLFAVNTFITFHSIVVDAVNYPVGITNCGISSWIGKTPERAISMNQGTTEVLLALGLADRTIGTAYIDDEIWGELKSDYEKVPVLSTSYPTAKQILDLKPDFLYASYSSAFSTDYVNYTGVVKNEDGANEKHVGFLDECELTIQRSNGKNRTHCRQELNDYGVQTYLQKPYCELVEHKPEEMTMDVLFSEIWEIATIFNVLDQGRILIDSIKDHFSMALEISEGFSSSTTTDKQPLKVLWVDSIQSDGDVFVGACCGAIQLILEHAGAQNVFGEKGLEERSSWTSVTWDEIAKTDPDVIVVIDAAWDSIEEKIFNLCNNTLSRDLRAVQNRAFLTVPFSASTLGVRIGALAYNLAEAFAALTHGTPLPALEFSQVGIRTVTKSGVNIFTSSLPEYNNSGKIENLEEQCPGTAPNLVVSSVARDFEAEEDEETGLAGWAIGLIAVLAVVAVGTVLFLLFVVQKERNGEPMFALNVKDTNMS